MMDKVTVKIMISNNNKQESRIEVFPSKSEFNIARIEAIKNFEKKHGSNHTFFRMDNLGNMTLFCNNSQNVLSWNLI